MSLDGDARDVIAMLKDAAVENHRRRSQGSDRRPFIAPNSVWAPGYAPHLLFTSAASATPELMIDRKKLGGRYVSVLAAVPIDDRELRAYDGDPAAFTGRLASDGRTTTYPRPVT